MRYALTVVALNCGLLCLTPPPSAATNEVDVQLIQRPGSVYDIEFTASKTGAATCQLTTPMINVPDCPIVDEEFTVVWTDLSIGDLQDETASDWTLIFDKSLGTETTVTLDLGFSDTNEIKVSDFPSIPMVIDPMDGATNAPQDTSIDWEAVTFPGAQIEVNLFGPSGPVNCDDSGGDDWPSGPGTCQPPVLLEPGDWIAVLEHFVNQRTTDDGIAVSGDPWAPENLTWVDLVSTGVSSFVVPEPATALLVAVGLVGLTVKRRHSMG